MVMFYCFLVEIMSDNSKRQLADELKQKVSDLVQSMNTLRSNLITAMGGGYICRRHNGSSSFDEAWVKADVRSAILHI